MVCISDTRIFLNHGVHTLQSDQSTTVKFHWEKGNAPGNCEITQRHRLTELQPGRVIQFSVEINLCPLLFIITFYSRT